MSTLLKRYSVIVLLALLGGCSQGGPSTPAPPTPSPHPSPTVLRSPSEQPPPRSRAIRFLAGDGTRLAGRLFGAGHLGVVLAHQIDNDQTAWFDFAGELASAGYLTLTFDFRGYCPGGMGGCSATGSLSETWRDVLGAVRTLRERGATHVWLIGASIGGDACLQAASTGAPGIGGVITMSSPSYVGAYDIRRSTMQRLTVPKLFIAGRFDGDAAKSARSFFRWSDEPRDMLVLQTGEHGTDLLDDTSPAIRSRVRGAILSEISAG
jgi:hypothetical protein